MEQIWNSHGGIPNRFEKNQFIKENQGNQCWNTNGIQTVEHDFRMEQKWNLRGGIKFWNGTNVELKGVEYKNGGGTQSIPGGVQQKWTLCKNQSGHFSTKNQKIY